MRRGRGRGRSCPQACLQRANLETVVCLKKAKGGLWEATGLCNCSWQRYPVYLLYGKVRRGAEHSYCDCCPGLER
ncbi:unnamed protein product [Choristocarpus tenellus]